jgi:Raf kinase inhibitor-like YbhB/YbcL family protein
VRIALGITLAGIALTLGCCSSTTGIPATPPPGSGAPSPATTEATSMNPATFSLASTAFDDGAGIPVRFTCDGEDVSPDLTWSGAPDGTESLAVIVTDPDARNFVHWLVYDLTGTPSGGLPAAVSASPDAPPQGTNSFGKTGYGGPCPPSGTHRYAFALYALDRSLELTGAPRIDELRVAMDGHVLAETTLTGTYQR